MPVSVTNGALSIFEDHNDTGAGPPLTVHHDADEIFAVTSACAPIAVELATACDKQLRVKSEFGQSLSAGPASLQQRA